MDEQTSDRILNRTSREGRLRVTVEGHGTFNVDASKGEPLRVAADHIWMLNTRKPVWTTFIAGNPWSLVSYDADAGTLVVRRKG